MNMSVANFLCECSIIWLTVTIMIFSFLLVFFRKNHFKKVPGPSGLPIVGYYPFLGKTPMASLHSLADKYGDIFKVKLLGKDYYILSSLENAREALVKQADKFMDRPVYEFNLLSALYGRKAYVHTEFDIYKIQKKFFSSKLSKVGMAKSDFEYRIHELCEDLVREIKKRQTITNLKELLSNVASNVILKLVFNEKYDINDPMFNGLLRDAQAIEESLTSLNMLLVGNLFYAKFRMNTKLWKSFKQSRKNLIDFIFERIKMRATHKNSANQNNDLLDYCIEESIGPNADCYDFKTLAGIFLLFFVAGTETTAGTIFNGITLLAMHPEIQKRMFEELEVYGKDSRILYPDVLKLNYTKACISEIQRFSCIVPLTLIHVNSVPTTVDGYFIPKGSKVLINIWKISRDKRCFKNPNNFDPSNFLDENGNFIANEANIPFGMGKRKCLGFKLAEIEIVILISNLVRQFEWCAPENKLIKYEIIDGGIRNLLPNKLIAKPRL